MLQFRYMIRRAISLKVARPGSVEPAKARGLGLGQREWAEAVRKTAATQAGAHAWLESEDWANLS
jgi:hypothetical protein